MISGIALVLDPKSPKFEILYTILETFLKDREASPDQDPTSRREVRIIRFLKNKAMSVRDGQTTAMQIDPVLEAKQHADLLLGLQGGPSVGPSPMAGNSMLPPVPGVPYPASLPLGAGSFFNGRSPGPYQLGSPGKDGGASNHTGSPIDDESAAQRLFDRWCATMGGDATGQFTDPVLTQWQAGQEPFSAFVSQPFTMDSDAPPTFPTNGSASPEGPDSFFWESLVNHLRPEIRAGQEA